MISNNMMKTLDEINNNNNNNNKIQINAYKIQIKPH